jgi:hypothetical protein
MRSAFLAFAVMTTLTTTSPPASAQVIEITPFIGAFLPIADLVEEDEFTAGHKPGVAGGVRLAYQTAGPFAIAASTMYASSALEIDDAGDVLDTAGHVLALAGTVRYRLTATQSGIQPHIAGGVAVLMRGGEAYDEFEWSGTTHVGGVVGVGVGMPLGQRFRLAVDLEDFISSASVQEGSQTSQARLQNDFVLSVGLIIALWTRR